ncbi:hypothetical protein [Microbacterium sp. OR16]|uniref:hypothetical protein n=1 Tax=Microbacterium sp. OR16 TaxID=3095345 RepID=UPI0039B3CAB0
MNVETTGVRRSAVYLWGALFVLAWALLSAVFSGGDARADDEAPAPLSGLTSLVGDTLGDVVAPVAKTATSTVEQIASPVVSTVEKAVEKTTAAVASVPVVGAPAAEVIATAGDTVSGVTQTVGAVAGSTPVSAIVTPVTDVIGSVPVVGAVVDGLGATDLVGEVATGVDGVLEVVPPVIDSTIKPVIDGLQPSIPTTGDTALPDAEVPFDTDSSQAGPAVGADAQPDAEPEALTAEATSAHPSTFAFAVSTSADASPPARDAAVQPAAPSGNPHGAPASGPGVVTPTAAVGGTGPAPGTSSDAPSSARLDDAAYSRTGIPDDAALPASPAGSTDISPD